MSPLSSEPGVKVAACGEVGLISLHCVIWTLGSE
jgi:hypothetical protein